MDDHDPRAQLAALESEIARLHKLLAKLKAQRAPLKRAINRSRAPFLSLPVELCSEIFTLAGNPMILGAVCSAWRALAWAMPWLWATVTLDTTRVTATHVELLADWVHRANGLPLHVELGIRREPSTHAPDATADLLRTLFRDSAHRIRALAVSGPCAALPHIPHLHLPILTHASLTCPCPRPHPHPLALTPTSAPLLHSLSLHNLPLPAPVPPTLTHLTLAPTTIAAALAALSALPSLTHLTLGPLTASQVLDPAPIEAHALTHLAIASDTRTQPSELLDALVLPNLEALDLTLPNTPFPALSVVRLAPRTLRLENVRVGATLLQQLRAALPGLTNLQLVRVPGLERKMLRALGLLGPLTYDGEEV
ncbi:hypothetical protein DXG01_002631 [Tephrocybe rancida]|nr:hypothetical protein DXG01_002631 [Tephrocybe rancida]